MKKFISAIVLASVSFGASAFDISGVAQGADVNVWVSADASLSGDGSQTNPYSSIYDALDAVRLARKDAAADRYGMFHIKIAPGTYYLDKTIILGPSDSGMAFEAAEGKVVLSGGVPVSAWTPAASPEGLPEDAQGHVWEAAIPTAGSMPLRIRQMWVDGRKARRASTFDATFLPQLISVDKEAKTLTVPRLGIALSRPSEVEMTIIQDWAVNIMRLNEIKDSEYRSVISFQPEESAIEFKRPWPILRASEDSYSNHRFYLSNAIEFLNRPHEWYNDEKAGKIYYWPAADEDMTKAVAVVPVLETLVSIAGTADEPVTDITFRGISFENATWKRPFDYGHVPLQCGQFIYDAYSDESAPGGNVAWVGRPAAAVEANYARNAGFEDCRFEHVGSTGIDFHMGVKDSYIKGCVFNETGGNAILGGYFGDENFESHMAWNPDDVREVCDNILVNNNYIAHPAQEDWGCLGVCFGFASNITISDNEIFDTPYSAINMGWGWTKETSCMHDNNITSNYIHHFSTEMRDSGAIYTLSSQKNSSITKNRIEDVGDPQRNPVMWNMRHAQFDLYTDEGTDYYKVGNNWLERGEISKNQNGSHNTWGSNGPSVSNAIKLDAGLKDGYKELPSTVRHAIYAPLDSIGGSNLDKNVIDFVAQGDGFKTGNAMGVDLNNDGRLDIVFSGGEGFQTLHGGVAMNAGDYGFVTTQSLKKVFMGNFAPGDLDGDGNVDLVQAGWDFWTCYNAVLHNDGNGRLIPQTVQGAETSPACGIADINNDGLPDYFFVGNGTANKFFIQQPDRTFAPGVSKLKLPGGFSDPNMVYADFNNDGYVDIILSSNKTGGVYTGLFLNDGAGNFTETDAGFTPKGTRAGMDFADVNNDGFLDIVLGGSVPGEAWNTTAVQGGKTATVYINDGTGHFTKGQEFSEYLFDNTTHPVAFCDWDNDGNVDLIIGGWNMSEGNVSRVHVYLNDGTGKFSLSDVKLPGASELSINVGDFNNSGLNDVLITGNCNEGYQGYSTDRRIAVLARNLGTKPNAAPEAPSSIEAKVDKDNVTLSWNAGSDAETPEKALSYNIYVRDLATGRYIISPMADVATGRRRVAQIGNAYPNKFRTLHNLPIGSYAWGVQTIDAGLTGSEFTPEQTFEIVTSDVKETPDEAAEMRVVVEGAKVSVYVTEKKSVDVVAVDGRLVACLDASPDKVATIRLAPGIYMIDHKKFMI